MKKITIWGGGSWGTALSILLAQRFERVHLWVRSPDLAAQLDSERENHTYLPGLRIPANIAIHSNIQDSLTGSDLLLCVLPSHAVRSIFSSSGLDPALPVVSATKGLEAGSLLRMSEVIAQAAGCRRIAVLSGPSFAMEAAKGCPTAVVVAANDQSLAECIQTAFSGSTFRVYKSGDPSGVEMGGAYKNVVAIGAGLCLGLGLGHNAIAALITRGLAEMTRLAVRMGADPSTLSGLAGLGDLVLTCTGSLSRNRRVGEQLALGRPIEAISRSLQMVAEGVGTTHSIVTLGQLHGVDLPIANQMDAVLNGIRTPREAIQMLMERSLKNETY
jgi:glycerol-3-phosphate dehydrogenase (NAD(P)+)